MSIILTPNMNLPVPVVGQELGPQYATDINNSLTQIDSHNHTSGQGVQIPTGGLNINSDLSFISNRATNLKSAQFTSQVSPLPAVSPDLGAIYVSGFDLYYNDTQGNQVRITQGGSVNSGAGSISGLVSPASASYSSIQTSFIWQSAVNTAAAMDNGPVTIREEVANAKGITIQSPSGLPNDYSLTLPSALPGAKELLAVDNTGNITATYDPPTYQLSLLGTSSVFTSSGTWTAPAGVNYIRVVACGGGGGGAGGGNAVFSIQHGSGGGGGGQMFEGVIQVTPGTTYNITIGAGGNGGASNAGPPAANGSAGGSTSFDVLMTVLGGNGGIQGSSGGAGWPGTHAGGDGQNGSGAGTTDTTAGGSYLLDRHSGNGGAGAAVTNGIGGAGGGAYGAGGNGGANFPGSVNGVSAAANTGGGGGGAVGGPVGGAGGNGGSGILIIYIQ